jgi:hypothetical protein
LAFLFENAIEHLTFREKGYPYPKENPSKRYCKIFYSFFSFSFKAKNGTHEGGESMIYWRMS